MLSSLGIIACSPGHEDKTVPNSALLLCTHPPPPCPNMG